MAKLRLHNLSRNRQMASDVRVASSFGQRTLGLMFQKSLPEGSALWIQGSRWIPTNSIHTFFMRFAIDLVFIDKNMKVKAAYSSVRPWRITKLVIGAESVIELPAGTLKEAPVQVGDVLYVGN